MSLTLSPAQSPRQVGSTVSSESYPRSHHSSVNRIVDRAKVNFDYEAEDDTNITISVGDVVVVVDKSDADWWWGHLERNPETIGFFPACFVEILSPSLVEKVVSGGILSDERPQHVRKDGQVMVEIVDEDFVEERFHQNREEDGGIKITEEIKKKYGNMEHLEKIHIEEGWATEEDKLYTPDMTGCLPTQEEILNLSMKGYIVRGRIVCHKGIVMNTDLQYQLETLGPDQLMKYSQEFYKDILEGTDLQKWWTPDSYNLSEKYKWVLDGKFCPPLGEYHLKEKMFQKNEEGFTMYSMCDNPECLKKSSLSMNVCAMGELPLPIKNHTMNYIKTRKIYTKKDDFYGNTDICQLCFEKNSNVREKQTEK